jgi:hypothetical protein
MNVSFSQKKMRAKTKSLGTLIGIILATGAWDTSVAGDAHSIEETRHSLKI